jgi:hypothetical protein
METNAEEYRDRIQRWQAMTPEERFAEIDRLNEQKLEAAKERVRKEMPSLSEEEVFKEVCARFNEIRRAELLGYTIVNSRHVFKGDPPTSAPP